MFFTALLSGSRCMCRTSVHQKKFRIFAPRHFSEFRKFLFLFYLGGAPTHAKKYFSA